QSHVLFETDAEFNAASGAESDSESDEDEADAESEENELDDELGAMSLMVMNPMPSPRLKGLMSS
ncbi:hypothetical protein BGZ90_008050, partial [Linnemannia elongata]